DPQAQTRRDFGKAVKLHFFHVLGVVKLLRPGSSLGRRTDGTDALVRVTASCYHVEFHRSVLSTAMVGRNHPFPDSLNGSGWSSRRTRTHLRPRRQTTTPICPRIPASWE